MTKKLRQIDLEKVCHILFDSAAEGLVVVDKGGAICAVNPRIEVLFEYKKEELLGKPIEVLIPETYRQAHVQHRAAYRENPSPRAMGIGMDLEASRKDGSTFPVEISLNHLDVEGEMLIMALITDITGRKKAEQELHRMNAELEQRIEERTQALQESQRLYKEIARNYPNGTISIFDRQLNYVFVEGMELYKMGITGDKLIGTNFLDRLDPTVKDDVKKQLAAVFDGKNTSFEVEHRNNKYILNAVGLHDEAGNIPQILVVEQNITRQKEAEENMRKALQQEQELNELKSRFVSMASHEFRTPLSTVLSSVSLLSKYTDKDEEKRQKHINRIKTSVHHLTNILNDFLSLDKLEQGKMESQPGTFNVQEMAEEVTEELHEMVKPGQTISYEHRGNTEVHLDKQMLKNIFNNLLSNAIKYSGENKTIAFLTVLDNGSLDIKVKDQGIGIPAEEQERLFQRFFRAKNATNIQGTGLGLNIIKKYVDLMKGSVSFESREGEGTEFTVKLPQSLDTTNK